ncbi:hypothetical protein EYF80_001377 [Liparis tanakae]|uniref:Uncharacterized protein n=1 Tax=Liparis tanakae TaxID=230148 RepID=A0A4Z2JFK1_9TELE|nr:hypothetical protein EYF80_001377 [Liparis tanakae]
MSESDGREELFKQRGAVVSEQPHRWTAGTQLHLPSEVSLSGESPSALESAALRLTSRADLSVLFFFFPRRY